MAKRDHLDIGQETLAHGLADNNIRVPTYQRPYTWKKDNVDDLLLDLGNSMQSGEPEYFLGPVVLVTTSEKWLEVVDGQQRLATTAILISAIRDHFHAAGDTETAREIERTYLFTRDFRTKLSNPKLELSELDNDYFYQVVIAPPEERKFDLEGRYESHRRIKKAAEICRAHVRRVAGDSANPTSALTDWLEYLAHNAKVIWVRVPDEANAFTIFETLNDRGIDLAVSDLLKNHLFRLSSPDRLRDTERRWKEMVNNLDSGSNEDAVVTYIRHEWSSLHGITRQRELYQKMKKMVNDKKTAMDFSSELANDSYVYGATLNTQHPLWNDYGSQARSAVETLNELGIIQVRPLLLAILLEFKQEDIPNALQYLVSTSVRLLVHGTAGTGFAESLYTNTAVNVRTRAIRDAVSLAAKTRDQIPPDPEFRQDFATATVSKSAVARIYLRALEGVARSERELETV